MSINDKVDLHENSHLSEIFEYYFKETDILTHNLSILSPNYVKTYTSYLGTDSHPMGFLPIFLQLLIWIDFLNSRFSITSFDPFLCSCIRLTHLNILSFFKWFRLNLIGFSFNNSYFQYFKTFYRFEFLNNRQNKENGYKTRILRLFVIPLTQFL